jgi:triphosphoribosyl-dephospho-CoA synthase
VTHALHDELALYPKPGLVSFVDNGSHADMTARTFVRSIVSLRDYFRQIAMLGASAPPFRDLQGLAIAAEQRMLQATAGANTHRGAIFTLGLLCAAAARYRHVTTEPLTAEFLRATLVETWGDALATHARHRDPSNGQRVCRRYGLRGARDEAAAGLPVLFDRAVPALMRAHLAGLDRRHALLQTFFVLMAALDDTNLVHRAGLGGLQFARREAQAFLSAGGAHRPDALVHAEAIHRAFVARRLSPGGSADMLAAASWVVRVCA